MLTPHSDLQTPVPLYATFVFLILEPSHCSLAVSVFYYNLRYSATVLLASALLLLDIPQDSERNLVPEGWWEQSCPAYMVFSRLSKQNDTFALAEG